MACIHQWIGLASGKLKNYQGSISSYRRACEQFSALYKAKPNSAVCILDLVAAQISLSGACLKSGVAEHRIEARQLLQQTEQLLDENHTGVSLAGFKARSRLYRSAVAQNMGGGLAEREDRPPTSLPD